MKTHQNQGGTPSGTTARCVERDNVLIRAAPLINLRVAVFWAAAVKKEKVTKHSQMPCQTKTDVV